ncbi:hypothetical protein [Dactylosporangium maewongense]
MPELPDPQDVVMHVLLWLGVPALLIGVLTTVLTLLAWKQFAVAAARHGRTALRTARDSALYWSTERQRATVKFVVCSACFIAIAYAVAQLVGFVVQLSQEESVTKVDHVDWQYVLDQALSYQRWGVASRWTVIAAAASIVLLNIADLARMRPLRQLLVGLWTAVLVVGLLGAAYLAFAGAALAIGLLMDPTAPVWLLVLEVLGILSLVLLPRLGKTIDTSSRQIYTFD